MSVDEFLSVEEFRWVPADIEVVQKFERMIQSTTDSVRKNKNQTHRIQDENSLVFSVYFRMIINSEKITFR